MRARALARAATTALPLEGPCGALRARARELACAAMGRFGRWVAVVGGAAMFGFVGAFVALSAGWLGWPGYLTVVSGSLLLYAACLIVGHAGDPVALRRRKGASRQGASRASALGPGSAAVLADAEQLVDVTRQAEAESLRDVALKNLDRLELELHDLAAACADQVVVMFSLERSLVPRALALRHERHLEEPRLDQERQDPVDGGGVGIDDAALAELLQQIVDREVASPLERRARDGVADRRPLQASLPHRAPQPFQRPL